MTHPTATRLFLVRHGATAATEEDRFSGSSGAELSEQGRWQAARLGERLARQNISAIYSSPLSRALTGGFTSSSGERALYGVLGWALLARNVRLAFGIATSAAARAEYRANVSFGVPNDYVRVAEDLLECSLASVGVGMTLLGVAALPLVFWLARGRR